VAFAVLPRVFWSGVEGRSYAMTALLAAAMTLALLVALDTGSKRIWVVYAAVIVVSIVWNIYLALVVAAHLVSLLTDRTITRPQQIRWFKTAAAAGVVSLPFVVPVSRQAGQVGTRDFNVVDLVQNAAINQWFLGDTPTRATGISTTSIRLGDVGTWWAPAAILFAGLAWLLIAHYVLRPAHRAAPSGGGRSPLAWLLPWIALPTAVIGGYSLVTTPTYSAQYLTFAAPAIAVLIGLGLLSIPAERLRVVAFAALVVAAIPIFVSQRQLYAKNSSDWVSVAEHIDEHATAGDGVYFAPRFDVGGTTVGRTTRGIQYAYPDGFDGLVDVTLLETPESAGDLIGRSRRLSDSGAELETIDTLWVIRRVDYPQTRREADDDFLAEAGFHQVSRWTGPLDVVLEFERA
jgi:mannosyltransferase